MKKIILLISTITSLCCANHKTTIGELKKELLDQALLLRQCLEICATQLMLNELKPLMAAQEAQDDFKKIAPNLKEQCAEKKIIIKKMLEIQKKLISQGATHDDVTKLSVIPVLMPVAIDEEDIH